MRSKRIVRKDVWVRIPPAAPKNSLQKAVSKERSPTRPGSRTGAGVPRELVDSVDSRSGYCAPRRSLGTTRTGHGATWSSR